MGIDPSIVEVLDAAVAADPENTALRTHFARVLLDADLHTRALAQAEIVLAARPADVAALEVASAAARATGDTTRADGFDQLLAALGGVTEPAPAPELATPLASSFDVELEALLQNATEDPVDVESVRMTLADVGGLDDVKTELERKFLGPMRNPELRAMYRKSLRGGLLLYGPPGCGKTYLARAVAGELGANFTSVGLNEVLDMWMGKSEQNVHELFQRARRNTPCVLFIDELDALGQKRSHLNHSGVRGVVVQLLTELDGFDGEQNEGVFVLGATNQPWDVDPALRRPGRFDRTLLVVPPDPAARAKILALQLAGRPTDAIDVEAVARQTGGYSGADLQLVCETATEFAIEASLRDGRTRPISQDDLVRAIGMTRPSTRAWFDLARNFVTFANADGEYDGLLGYMKAQRLL